MARATRMGITAALVTAALALAVGPMHRAEANGRPPFTNGIQMQPGVPDTIYVATTFGLLVTHDGGCSFNWICEQNVGYGGTFDPKYRVAADGTIYATTFNGLQVSYDNGCSFVTATADQPVGTPGKFDGIWVDAIDVTADQTVWVATAESGKPNEIYKSTDDARTFTPMGLLSNSIWWKSVVSAKTRTQRVYVAGYQISGVADDGGLEPPTAFIFATDDDGVSWEPRPLDGVAFGQTPLVYVDAVDPTEPDRLWMHSSGANPPNGDIVYRSADGGATWQQVVATTQAVTGVVVRNDGTVIVATTSGGSFTSNDHGVTFQSLANAPQMACVAERSDGLLFACGANWGPDFFSIGSSPDATTWTEVFRFVNLSGPLDCPAGTMEHDVCGVQLWPALQQQFGSMAPACAMLDAGPVTMPDAVPRDVTSPKLSGGGGCCDASGQSTSLGALAMLVAIVFAGVNLLTRRRSS